MKTTLEEIRSHRPCKDGWKLLTKTLGRTTGPVTLKEVYESNGHNDAVWCLCCFLFTSYRPWIVEVVEAALPAFEKVFPEDKGPRQAIEAVKNGASEAELGAAYAAAYVAAYAARATAARAADAAYAATAACAADAAYAAACAAAACAASATYAAARAAYAARAARAACAFATGPETIEAIFIKHFCN